MSAAARPLTDGELSAAKAVGALTAGLGLLGFANSFRAVARAAGPSFGAMAPTVPLGIDLAIAVFSALDIVLARLDMRPRWVRLVPWSLTGATVYLNVAGQATWFGRVAHAVFPALWVVAVSLAAHVIRVRAHLATGTAMDRVRGARWALAPLPTARLWRRMVLWEIRSYPDALDRERARLLALTGLQDAYGVIAWRWKAPRRTRALYRLGELMPQDLVQGHQDRTEPDRTEPDRTELQPTCTEAPAPADEAVSTEPERTDEQERTEDGRTGLTASRDAVVASLAEEIRDAIEAGERWRPDYPALMERTGRRRSWCEKAVRDARMAVLDSPDTGAGELRTDEDPDAEDRTGQLVLTGAL